MDKVMIPKHLKPLFELRLREAKLDVDVYVLDAQKRKKAENRVTYWNNKLNKLKKQGGDDE